MDAAGVLDRIHSLVDRRRGLLSAPGFTVGITDRERSLGELRVGVADLVSGTPVGPDHLFLIASVSKSFTANALLQEHEAGRLDLHAPVATYLPWFADIPSPRPITVRHLLSHTSGLASGHDFTGEARHEVWALREQPTGFQPGERMHYSNAGYKALGLILERLAGAPYGEVIRERILTPLGMSATEPVMTQETRRKLATGHVPAFDDRPWHSSHGLVPANWMDSGTADGTICSNVADLGRYLRALLAEGRPLISPESFALQTGRYARDEDEGVAYGYGLFTDEGAGRRRIGHSGSFNGFTAFVLFDPEAGFGVSFLANGPTGWRTRLELCRFALDALEAAAAGSPEPDLPSPATRTTVPEAPEVAGTYRDEDGAVVVLEVHGDGLASIEPDGPVSLERLAGDTYVVPLERWGRFPLRVEREGGIPVRLVHGARTFVREGAPSRVAGEVDEIAWEPLAGHYRLNTPLGLNVRVLARAGTLRLLSGDGEEDHELVGLPDGSFRVGSDAGSPGRIRFDAVLDGVATRAVYDGAPYHRTFTP